MSQFFASGGQSFWSFSFNISPSNEYSVLISFRMDWLDLLAVQGTLKCLLQHHSSKASVLPERIQIKISQRKKYRRHDILGLQMWVFCCPFSEESGYLILGYQHVKMQIEDCQTVRLTVAVSNCSLRLHQEFMINSLYFHVGDLSVQVGQNSPSKE